MKHSRTLILGGGFGGLTVARTLRGLVPREHEVVLIDKSPTFHVGATKTWVMLGQTTPDEVMRRRKMLGLDGVRLIEAEVSAIDAKAGRVMTDVGSLEGDFVVIALGAALNMNAIPGLADAAHTFYTMQGAARLREDLQRLVGGQVVILIPRIPFQCPPAPYEAALLLDDQFRRRGIRQQTKLSIFTVEVAPMSTAGPEMGNFIKGKLAERDIAFSPQKKTISAASASRRVAFEDGSDVGYDLLIAVPPHEVPRVARDAGLVGESGWISVDPETLRVKTVADRAVYAIGDIAGIPLPGRFKPDMPLSLPKAGTLAEGQGTTAATQIASQILGTSAKAFDGRGFCYIELGDSMAIRGDGEFFAQPHPFMRPTAPAEERYREKLQWVDQWLEAPRVSS